MEIQEPTLRALVLHFSWSLSPRFVDVRGVITDVLREATGSLDDWTWDSGGPLVAAWNQEKRLHFIITGQGIDIVNESPADPLPAVEAVLPACAEILNVREVNKCGAAAAWLLASPTLGDASSGLEATVAHGDLRRRLEPLGGRPQRLEMRATFEDGQGTTTRLRLKPVTAEELVEDAEYFLSDVESSDVPPAGVFARINRERDEANGIADAVAVSARLLDGVRRAGDKFLATLVTA